MDTEPKTGERRVTAKDESFLATKKLDWQCDIKDSFFYTNITFWPVVKTVFMIVHEYNEAPLNTLLLFISLQTRIWL